MDSYFDENLYSEQNNIQYYNTITSNSENNNNIYNTKTQSYSYYETPMSEYETNIYPFLTKNNNTYLDTISQNYYGIKNIPNIYNNTQYKEIIKYPKIHQTSSVNNLTKPNIKLYPVNQNNIIKRMPSIQTFNYKLNKNNLEQMNIKRANTVINVNNTIQRINNNEPKPVKNIYDNIIYNYDNESLSADKKRVSNNYYTNIKKPIRHISENNISNIQSISLRNFNNIIFAKVQPIKQIQQNKGPIRDIAKVTKIEDNLVNIQKVASKENNPNINNYKTEENINNNQLYNNQKAHNYVQNENKPKINEPVVSDNIKLIDNMNLNDNNNKSFLSKSLNIPNNKAVINNNYFTNEYDIINNIIKENIDSYIDNQYMTEINSNINNKIIQNKKQINHEIQPKEKDINHINVQNKTSNNQISYNNTNKTTANVPKEKITTNQTTDVPNKTITKPILQYPFISINGELISNNNCVQYFRQTTTAPVKSYGYSQNQGRRNYMEDEGKVIENLNGDKKKILFAIFDGHGGGQISKYLQNNIGDYIKKIINILNNENYTKAFIDLFNLIDKDIKNLNYPTVGSTGTVVYIEKKENKRILYCANVGDTRCVLVKKNKAKRLSYDDRVADQNEKERILNNGGIIVNGRVYGILMLSRSFGDFLTKDFGVIVTPHVIKYEITEDDLYCVIASDGVWDAIEDIDCNVLPKMGKMGLETGELSKRIINEALKRKSKDNLSCFVIKLN